MLLMIDNYDSFTYNLVQYLGELGVAVQVFRNDQISLKQIRLLSLRAPVPRTRPVYRLTRSGNSPGGFPFWASVSGISPSVRPLGGASCTHTR